MHCAYHEFTVEHVATAPHAVAPAQLAPPHWPYIVCVATTGAAGCVIRLSDAVVASVVGRGIENAEFSSATEVAGAEELTAAAELAGAEELAGSGAAELARAGGGAAGAPMAGLEPLLKGALPTHWLQETEVAVPMARLVPEEPKNRAAAPSSMQRSKFTTASVECGG